MEIYNPTQKQFLTALLAAIFGCLLLFGFVFLSITKFKQVGEEIQKTQEASLGTENIIRLKKNIGDLSSQVAVLDSFFLSVGEEALFVEKVESLAKSNGLKVETDSISISNDGANKDFELVNMSVKFEGGWTESIAFLKALERMPKAVTLKEVNVNYNTTAWAGTLKLSVYKMKQ